ncbi:MAG: multiheme c-type cytochrome [Polyangiales bacterium]
MTQPRFTSVLGWVLWSSVLVVVVGAAWQWSRAGEARAAETAHRPIEVQDQGYVSSDACRSCHPGQYATWSASYHRGMTQHATPATVVGEFDGHTTFGEGPYYRVGRDGDQFYFEQADTATSAYTRKPVSLVTGSHHMQIYWYETGETRKLGQVPYVYLTADRRWVPRAMVFLEPPSAMRRPDESGRWSQSCIACHTTQGQPRITDKGEFDTQVAELGIACEACHGPGAEHVAKHSSPWGRYTRHLQPAADSSIVQPKRLDHERASQICSQCHSLWQDADWNAWNDWNTHGPAYRPGTDAAASRWLLQPSQRDKEPRVAAVMKQEPRYVNGQFWSDGQARVSGREYSGMIDSPCYQPGKLSCLSCHSMHQEAHDARPVRAWADDQLSVGMETDHACVQCHASFKGKAQVTAHTKHPAESEGSRCYNCHMPNTSYGLLKAMRSHRISVPSAAETAQTGRPNACNLCHLDKSLGWTEAQLHERFQSQDPPLTLSDEQRDLALAVWLGVQGDAGQRALIAGALGWKPAQQASDQRFMPVLLGLLMDDAYDAVRYMAERSLRSLPGIDTSQLQYDFVKRPHERPRVREHIAGLARPELPLADAARLQGQIERLLPRRDVRAVLLLE